MVVWRGMNEMGRDEREDRWDDGRVRKIEQKI